MEVVVTAGGKTFISDYFTRISTPPRAYMRVKTDASTAKRVFSDPAETKSIKVGNVTINGYTRLINVTAEGDFTRVSLAKEENNGTE